MTGAGYRNILAPVLLLEFLYMFINMFVYNFKGSCTVQCKHIRRMERDTKAKVVASVWGADFV